MVDLRCMSYTSKGTSELVVAGLQGSMFIVDVERGVIIDEVRSAEGGKVPYPALAITDSCLKIRFQPKRAIR